MLDLKAGNFWLALSLTTLAGISTGIGSAMVLLAKHTNYRFLSIATGFSAGAMLYISFVEIMCKATDALTTALGEKTGNLITVLSFFAGIGLILIIDSLVPRDENPHETRSEAQVDKLHEYDAAPRPHVAKLFRTGLFTALAIGIHNFPEGLATFMASLEDPTLGIAIAVAVALHNIPEGVSVAVPIYYATEKRRVAMGYSFLSGLAEPTGALLGYLLVRPFISPATMGGIFAGVAGIMVFISLDQLLPTSRAFGRGHDSLFGLLSGMAIVAGSLLMLKSA